MQRIVVLNPKGGSGKTTLAINLAAYFALRGDSTLLIDRDPQGSATRWLRKRRAPQAEIRCIATFERDQRTTMSWQMRVPEGTRWAPPDIEWSVRWVLLHLVHETARHAGHADIIRESIDGATMYPLMAGAEGWPETDWMKPWKPPA